jgi:iron complex outermembrane receptor protein
LSPAAFADLAGRQTLSRPPTLWHHPLPARTPVANPEDPTTAMNALHALVLAAAITPSPDTLVVPIPGLIVTGTRTVETQLRAPAAISLVGRGEFADTRGISLKDALGGVPGVFVQSRSGAHDIRITIRGFGARGNGERSNTGNIRGIRVMTDGIPVTEPDGRSSLDLVDLGSAGAVEVQRSNASALFGNASGGVINVRSDLRFERPFVEMRERAGSFGYHREQGVLGFAVGPGRGTVSLLNSTLDGWRPHSSSGATQLQARFAAPLDQGTRLGVLIDAVSDLNRFPGALTQAELDVDARQANPTFVTRDERRWNRVGRAAITVDRAIGDGQNLSFNVFAEPKVLQRSERNRFRDFTRIHVGGGATYELRARLTPSLESRTVIGGDEAFQDGSILFYDLSANGGRGETTIANKREAANSAGGFAEQELRWSDRWSARLAVRYDNMHYISEDHILPALNAAKTFSRATPKGSLSYRFDRHTVYAALGGGVEAPAFNEIDPPAPFDTMTSFNPFLEAMRSRTYEIGAKGSVADLSSLGQIRYDLGLYRIEVLNDIVPFDGGAYFLTAGRSRRQGLELGLDWLPLRAVIVESAVTVSDNKYVEYANELGDFSGNQVSGLPRATVSVKARYQGPAGVSTEVRVESVGAYYADDANTARAPAYAIVGATLGYGGAVGEGSLRAFVGGDNLADRHHVSSVFINGTGGRFFEPGMPRNWSAGLTLRWR